MDYLGGQARELIEALQYGIDIDVNSGEIKIGMQSYDLMNGFFCPPRLPRRYCVNAEKGAAIFAIPMIDEIVEALAATATFRQVGRHRARWVVSRYRSIRCWR